MRHVILVPGSGRAAHTFRDVIPALPPDWHPVLFDLDDSSGLGAPGFTWQSLVDRLRQTAEGLDGEVGFIGLSAGAALGLAYIAAYPDAFRGLALIEPAFAYLPLTPVESDYYAALEKVLQLPPEAQLDAFRHLLVAPGVTLPPLKPASGAGYAEASRPEDTGLARVTRTMLSHRVAPDYLSRYEHPIYLVVGGRSNTMWREQAQQIALRHRWTRVEVFDDRHHLDTALHTEVDRFIAGIRTAWGE